MQVSLSSFQFALSELGLREPGHVNANILASNITVTSEGFCFQTMSPMSPVGIHETVTGYVLLKVGGKSSNVYSF